MIWLNIESAANRVKSRFLIDFLRRKPEGEMTIKCPIFGIFFNSSFHSKHEELNQCWVHSVQRLMFAGVCWGTYV